MTEVTTQMRAAAKKEGKRRESKKRKRHYEIELLQGEREK